MTPPDPQPPAQHHSLSPTSVEEEEDDDLSQMLKNSIQHQHGNSSPCTTSVRRRTGKNRTTARIRNPSTSRPLGKTPAAVPSSTEDDERLDAFRLARIILGRHTPSSSTDPTNKKKPFISHNAILHAIRKVAEMKIQILQLTEQLDRYQERDKQQQLQGYKEQLFQKQQQYLFSAVSATTNTTTSTEHQDDGKEEEEELLNEKNEANSEETILGIEGNYDNNNGIHNKSDSKKETHNIDISNDGQNGHDKDKDQNAAISTTSNNNTTEDVSVRRKQAIRVLQKESNWAQNQLRELESSQLQQYEDNDDDNDNDDDETTNNNVANTSTSETEGQQQKPTECHNYEYRAAASVVGATNDDGATVESMGAPILVEDDDDSDSNYKTTNQKRSNDDDVNNNNNNTKHTTNNRTTVTATTPTAIWRIRDTNYDRNNKYSSNSNNNNNNNSYDGRQNISNLQEKEERKREMQTRMLDELYTNLYSKFETNTNTNNPRSQTGKHLLDTTLSTTTTTTTTATRKPGIGKSVLQHQHPKDVAMMTLLEASLPPIDEIQQVLQRVVEFEESVLLQQQEQQRHAHDGDSTRIRSSSAVNDEVTSLLSRLLQCQLKLKKTRTMLQSEQEETKTIIDVVDDHNLLFDNGIGVGIEYNNTTGAEIRRRRQQQQRDGGDGGDKNSIGGCDSSSIRSDTSGSDNQVEEPVTVWLNRWSDMKNRQSRSTEILQFLHLQRQLLLYDIQAMKINDDFFINDRTIMSLSFDSLDDPNENADDDDDDDDNYNRLRLRLEESEYQKQIGYMMKNEENRIQEIDTLEVELTSLSFIAAQLEDDRINQFRNRTQSFVNELYSLRRNVTNFIEDETVKIFGVASSNKNKVGTTSNGDDAIDIAISVGREEETPDNRIKRLEYLLTKKNIELFTTKAKLKLTEEKLRQNDNNQKHHQLESNPDALDKFPDIIAIRSL